MSIDGALREAMAVAAGLGGQFVQAAGSGTFQAVTFEGSRGCTGSTR